MIGIELPQLPGYRNLTLDLCTSTNQLAKEYAQNGEANGLWITAKNQSHGKGSRGRNWESAEGNLFTTLMLRDPCDQLKDLSQLTFVAAVSLGKVLVSVAGDKAQVGLKWPNDILLNGKKCSGILLESQMNNSQLVVVIGFGLNCKSHPAGTNYPATDLREEGLDLEGTQAFELLANSFAQTLEQWDRGNNFEAIRNAWLHMAIGVGEQIIIKRPQFEDMQGQFISIDEEGYLLLSTPDNIIHRISTADVFFPTLKKHRSRSNVIE